MSATMRDEALQWMAIDKTHFIIFMSKIAPRKRRSTKTLRCLRFWDGIWQFFQVIEFERILSIGTEMDSVGLSPGVVDSNSKSPTVET